MVIREGKREDAPFLAEVVMEAVGEELCISLAEGADRLPLVKKLFTALASEEESQYSFTNAFICTADDGSRLGGIIAYDGARLRHLRKAFVRQANRILGWTVTEQESENWGDEADAGEIYIDSIYVVEEARQQGIATALLRAVEEKFRDSGKPPGLLVEPENKTALETYKKWKFREVGVSNFFYTPMIHMQKL